jgi:glutamate racemase
MNAPCKALYHPLGIFDAGIGSYAIVRLVQQRFPDQDIIYLADRASFPYGAKDKCALQQVVTSAISRLRGLGAEAVLVASNAPTITVLKDVKQLLDGPIFGVNPPVTRAITASKTKSVGVLGVKSLIESSELRRYIDAENTCGASVLTFNASPLVELVESGAFLNRPLATIEIVRSFVSSILVAHGDIDGLHTVVDTSPLAESSSGSGVSGAAFSGPGGGNGRVACTLCHAWKWSDLVRGDRQR